MNKAHFDRLRLMGLLWCLSVLIGLAATAQGVHAEDGSCSFKCKNYNCQAFGMDCTKCSYDEDACSYKFGPCTFVDFQSSQCPKQDADENGVYEYEPPQ
jgi:hypothetical protein